MPNRSEIQAFLIANGFEAQANDQASLVFAEGLVEALGEPSDAMIEANLALSGAEPDARQWAIDEWKAMWAARFRGE